MPALPTPDPTTIPSCPRRVGWMKSASATPSTFSTTVFPDGSLRYRYMRIGDKADWTAGVSGNSFVSPTIR